MDEYLWEMLKGQMIPLDLFLEHTSLPFANNLLQALKQKKEKQQAQIEQAMAQDPQSQEILNNPENQQFLQNLGLN